MIVKAKLWKNNRDTSLIFSYNFAFVMQCNPKLHSPNKSSVKFQLLNIANRVDFLCQDIEYDKMYSRVSRNPFRPHWTPGISGL